MLLNQDTFQSCQKSKNNYTYFFNHFLLMSLFKYLNIYGKASASLFFQTHFLTMLHNDCKMNLKLSKFHTSEWLFLFILLQKNIVKIECKQFVCFVKKIKHVDTKSMCINPKTKSKQYQKCLIILAKLR